MGDGIRNPFEIRGDGFRIVCVRDCVRLELDGRLQPAADQPEVRCEILHAEGLHGRERIGRHHMEQLGDGSLRGPQELGVERELENCPAAGFLRELGVDDLVGPRAQSAWRLDATKYVGTAEPWILSKGALEDDIGARAHGVRGAGHRDVATHVREIDHRQPLGSQPVSVPSLVVEPALLEGDHRGVDPLGRFAHALRYREVHGSPVPAAEEIRQIGRGQLDRRAD